ncbi:MAG: hypothetical protein WCH86_04655 [Kiritimatiellales bacterium]
MIQIVQNIMNEAGFAKLNSSKINVLQRLIISSHWKNLMLGRGWNFGSSPVGSGRESVAIANLGQYFQQKETKGIKGWMG